MVLVDTSVWVAHFRRKNDRLENLLSQEFVYCHPFIIGELACGHLKNRQEILSLMGELPEAIQATDKDVLVFIEKHRLAGKGLGIVDTHLLACASLSNLFIWTDDKRMRQAARDLHMMEPLI
jgi:predicted nucleic acid-binding protein